VDRAILRPLVTMPVRKHRARRHRQMSLEPAPPRSTMAEPGGGRTSCIFVKVKGMFDSEGVTDNYNRGHGMRVIGMVLACTSSGLEMHSLRFAAEPYAPCMVHMVTRSRMLVDRRGMHLACRCPKTGDVDHHQASGMWAAMANLDLLIASVNERHADVPGLAIATAGSTGPGTPCAVLITRSAWVYLRVSVGACAASRRCQDSRLAQELLTSPTPTLRQCRGGARGKGRIHRTAWTVVARRDHLLLCCTVSMVMIVAGTNFQCISHAASLPATRGRRSGALRLRHLLGGEGAHLSREGRASRLAAGR
jgi:hypothetical protein